MGGAERAAEKVGAVMLTKEVDGYTLSVEWDREELPWDADESVPEPRFNLCGLVCDPRPGAFYHLACIGSVGVESPTDPYLLDVERELLDEAAIEIKTAPRSREAPDPAFRVPVVWAPSRVGGK